MDLQLNEEQTMFRQMVRDFSEKELKSRARHTDEAAEFNWEAVKKMGPLGLLGLNVPEEYGGPGIDPLSAAIAIEEIGWGCGSTGLAIAAHNGLGCAPIVLFGTEEQKRRWLPPLATGQGKLGALALTEPGAGSDLQGGVRVTARRDGSEWVINGEKMWCTNASVADLITTLCRTNPAGGTRSLSMIIVPTNSPGLKIGPPEKKMGLKGSHTNAVLYDEVRVPAENLLGTEGRGLHQALQTLDGGRISIGALSVGLAQAACDEALRYAQERQAFGGPIGQLYAIQEKLAYMATLTEAARLMIYRAAWLKQQGKPFGKEAAMGKLFASEVSEKVCFEAVQIHGGYGYSTEFPVERMYRDQRLMSIGEGTNEILRMVIARHLLA